MISENAKFVRLNGEPKLFHVVGFKEDKVIVKRRGNSQRVRHCKLTEITGEVVEAIRDSNNGWYEIGDLFEVGYRIIDGQSFSEKIYGPFYQSQNFKVVQVPKMNIESKPATHPAKPIAGDYVRFKDSPEIYRLDRYDGHVEGIVFLKRGGETKCDYVNKIEKVEGEVVEVVQNSILSIWPYKIGDLLEVAKRDRKHNVDWIYFVGCQGEEWDANLFRTVQPPNNSAKQPTKTEEKEKPMASAKISNDARFVRCVKDSPDSRVKIGAIYRVFKAGPITDGIFIDAFGSMVHEFPVSQFEEVTGEVVEVIKTNSHADFNYKIGDLLEVKNRSSDNTWVHFCDDHGWHHSLFKTVQVPKINIAQDQPGSTPVEPGSHLSNLDKSQAKQPSQQELEPQDEFNVGDLVQVREWNDMAKGREVHYGGIRFQSHYFSEEMKRFCGKEFKIEEKRTSSFRLGGCGLYGFTKEMLKKIEAKPEAKKEETKLESPPDKSEANESQPSEKPLKDRKFVRCVDDSNSRILVKRFYYELKGESDGGELFLHNVGEHGPWDHSRFEPVEVLGWVKREYYGTIHPVIRFEPMTIIADSTAYTTPVPDRYEIIEDYRPKAKTEPAPEPKPQKPTGVPVQVKVVKACPGLTEGKVYDAIRQGDGRYYIERNDDGVPFADNYRHKTGWTKFEKYVKCVDTDGAQEFLKIDSAYPVIFGYGNASYEIFEGDIGMIRGKWRFTDFNHSLVKEYRSMFSRIATLFSLAKSAAVFVAFAVTAATCWAIYQLNIGQLTGAQLEESAISLGNEISPYLLYAKEGWGYLRELGPLGAIGIAAAYLKRNWKTLLRNGLAAIEVTSAPDEAKK